MRAKSAEAQTALIPSRVSTTSLKVRVLPLLRRCVDVIRTTVEATLALSRFLSAIPVAMDRSWQYRSREMGSGYPSGEQKAISVQKRALSYLC